MNEQKFCVSVQQRHAASHYGLMHRDCLRNEQNMYKLFSIDKVGFERKEGNILLWNCLYWLISFHANSVLLPRTFLNPHKTLEEGQREGQENRTINEGETESEKWKYSLKGKGWGDWDGNWPQLKFWHCSPSKCELDMVHSVLTLVFLEETLQWILKSCLAVKYCAWILWIYCEGSPIPMISLCIWPNPKHLKLISLPYYAFGRKSQT